MSEVTIAICTFGRSEFIVKCLTEFSRLYEKSDFCPRLIVIDNNRDNITLDKIASLIDGNEYFFCVNERKIGLCNARNRAIEECNTKYLLFIDDDAYPTENFLAELKKTVANEFDVGGGGEISYSDKQLPAWYKKNFLGKNNHIEYFSGFNIIFKVETIKSVGGFSTNIGMKGKKSGYGDEILPQLLIKQRNGVFFYNPELLVHHYIQQYKLTRSWQFQYSFNYGKDSWRIYDKERLVLRDLLHLAFQLLKVPKQKNLFQSLRHKFYQVGRLYGAFDHLK